MGFEIVTCDKCSAAVRSTDESCKHCGESFLPIDIAERGAWDGIAAVDSYHGEIEALPLGTQIERLQRTVASDSEAWDAPARNAMAFETVVEEHQQTDANRALYYAAYQLAAVEHVARLVADITANIEWRT